MNINLKNIIMGCHTWCSVSLPEKQRDWRKQLLETVKTTLLDLKNDIADTTSLRNCSEEYSKHYIDTIKFCEDKIKESTDQNMINRLQTELEHSKIELEAWKLENLIKDTKDRVTKIEKFLDNFQETYLDSPKDFENWWKTGEDLVDTYVFFELGDIIVKDGKIYKETYRLVENDEIDNTLGGIHDGVIRIQNYDAEPCYSAQDVLDRAKEEGVILSPADINQIKEWYEKYPDTIIEFG